MQVRGQMIMRALAVAAVAASPLAALEADAAVTTGDARANGPGIAVENTGGNVEFGVGHSESKVVLGDGGGAVPAVAAPNALTTRAVPAAPNASAQARAKALVDAARARAQAQIDEARRQADEAVARAKQQAEEARAHAEQQSNDAQARSENSSAAANSSSASSYTDD
jgi:hypothetical protein